MRVLHVFTHQTCTSLPDLARRMEKKIYTRIIARYYRDIGVLSLSASDFTTALIE